MFNFSFFLNVKVNIIDNFEKRLINSKFPSSGKVIKYFRNCLMEKKIVTISTFKSEQSAKLKKGTALRLIKAQYSEKYGIELKSDSVRFEDILNI